MLARQFVQLVSQQRLRPGTFTSRGPVWALRFANIAIPKPVHSTRSTKRSGPVSCTRRAKATIPTTTAPTAFTLQELDALLPGFRAYVTQRGQSNSDAKGKGWTRPAFEWDGEQWLEHNPLKVIESTSEANLPPTGRYYAFAQILAHIQTLSKHGRKWTKQRTVALVHRGASEVGKTFTGNAYRHVMSQLHPPAPAKKYEWLSLYLGFNQGWGLVDDEDHEIHQDPRLGVARVLWLRLAAALAAIVKVVMAKGSLNRAFDPSIPYQWMPAPADEDEWQPSFDRRMLKAIPAVVKKQLNTLKALCGCATGSKRLALLLVIDELQFLDDIVPPRNVGSDSAGGARQALRWARQLQCAVGKFSNGRIVLLPFGTGIRPEVSVASRTTGKNVELSNGDAAYVTIEDFHKLTRTSLLRSRRKEIATMDSDLKKSWNEWTDIVAMALHPHVRRLTELGGSGGFVELSSELHNVDEKKRADLLFSHLTETRMTLSGIPLAVPFRESRAGHAIPILSLPSWRALYPDAELPVIGHAAALSLKPPARTWNNFEELAIKVLGWYLTVRRDLIHGRAEADVAAALRQCDKLNNVERWLDIPVDTFFPVTANPLRDATRFLLPFDNRGTPHLHRTVVERLQNAAREFKRLLKPQGFVLWCAGRSPLDLIVFVVSHADDGDGLELRVRLADMKHTWTSTTTMKETTMTDMLAKARGVYEGIRLCSEKQVNLRVLEEFQPQFFRLVTNCDVTHFARRDMCLAASTFAFEPFTWALFGPSGCGDFTWTQKKEKNTAKGQRGKFGRRATTHGRKKSRIVACR